MIQYVLDNVLKLTYDLNLIRLSSILIHFGADINRKYTYFHNSGEKHSLLDFAILDNQPNFVELLLKNEAKQNFMKNQVSNAVCIACFRGHYAVIKTLLNHGIPINNIKNGGHIPLIAALISGQNFEIAKLLLRSSIESELLNHTFITLFSTSDLFAQKEQTYLIESIKILLNYGANINHQSDDMTPMSLLIQSRVSGRFDKIFDYLVQNGANIYFENKFGHSLLFMAIMSDNIYTKKLMNAGFDVDHRNQSDMTTLMTICDSLNKRAQARHLINFKPNLDLTRKSDGNTALHFAAQSGKTMDVKTLLENGANFAIKNAENLTALDIARRTNHRSIIDLIENHINDQKKEIQQQFMAL